MYTEIVLYGALAAVLFICSILIFTGKGDWLISGYNTASPEERAQYNVRRLRLIMGTGTSLVGFVIIGNIFIDAQWFTIVTIIPICIAILILGNTWAKN